MLRRHLLKIVCLSLGGLLALVCAYVTLNFVRLGEAQSFVQDFVKRAIDEGSAMPLPAVSPSASATLSHDAMRAILERARQIGPLVGIEQESCKTEADSTNICGGQIMACVVTGIGRQGAFEADIALCRGGDLAPYLLAASRWRFSFINGDPLERQDRSPI